MCSSSIMGISRNFSAPAPMGPYCRGTMCGSVISSMAVSVDFSKKIVNPFEDGYFEKEQEQLRQVDNIFSCLGARSLTKALLSCNLESYNNTNNLLLDSSNGLGDDDDNDNDHETGTKTSSSSRTKNPFLANLNMRRNHLNHFEPYESS